MEKMTLGRHNECKLLCVRGTFNAFEDSTINKISVFFRAS